MNRSLIKRLLFIPIVFGLLTIHSSLFAKDAEPYLGTWKGAISAMGQELEIIIEFLLDDEENIQGNIDVPTQGATDLPLGSIQIEGKMISFKIVHPEVQGDPTFKGELDESGKKIFGDFSQGGAEGTFSIEKE
ncbi:MAG: hypothetical protein GTO17_12775 [Candidatus Aminicenantes bacterium]|nr:hypothetical protein [Candidatus Aminicenantes bacterium]